MALIHCPDCEKEVSSRAHVCPQCAYPIENLTNLPDAIRQNDIEMLKDLLRAGYKPNETNEDGFTPLMMACQQGNFKATKVLVNSGAELNSQDSDGCTALMQAATQGNDPIARLLIEKGADPAIKNVLGLTALDLALEAENDDLIAILQLAEEDSESEKPESEHSEHTEEIRDDPDARPVPNISTESASDVRSDRPTSPAEPPHVPVEPPHIPIDPPAVPVGPPPLPKEAIPVQRVRFIDDLAPVVDDEKYSGPGLICRTCREQIAAEDIWCSHCKAPIIRRYCGGCHQLIPDNAARCPYCQSSKLNRFRYFRHLEQMVAGATILGVLLFVLGIYNPQDSSSYGKKLAQKRAEQQEQTDIAAEETSKKLKEQRTNGKRTQSKTAPAMIRVVPRQAEESQILKARGNSNDIQNRIPTVERIEIAPATPEKDRTELKPQVGKPVEEPKPQLSGTIKEETNQSPEMEQTEEPEIARRLNDQGFRLMKNGRYAEAIPVLAEAVRSFPVGKKDPTYAYALYNLGRSLRLAGRPDLAIPILEERMKFADQRHLVARELEQARTEVSGPEQFDNIQFE